MTTTALVDWPVVRSAEDEHAALFGALNNMVRLRDVVLDRLPVFTDDQLLQMWQYAREWGASAWLVQCAICAEEKRRAERLAGGRGKIDVAGTGIMAALARRAAEMGDPTALFWRSTPDYAVRPRGGGRCWLAEVKGPSEQWRNLVLEATQLLNLYLLAQCLWLDIRYVYAAQGQPLRAQGVEEVHASVETVFVNPDHPSVATLRRLRRQTDVRWEERPNARFFDPYVKVAAETLARWPEVLPALATRAGGDGDGAN